MDSSVVDISVANTNVATIPWFAIRREQAHKKMMAQYGRTEFMAIGYIVWGYHTPTARTTEKKRERRRQGGERESGGRARPPAGARRPLNSVAWLGFTDLWVMSPTR